MNNKSLITLKALSTKFDRASNTYLANAEIQKISEEKIKLLLKKTMKEFPQENPLKILDLGCGPGFNLNNSFLESKQNVNTDFIGLDISPKMLNLCSYSKKIIADAHEIPIQSQSVDIIISNLMIQWSTNPRGIIQEICRVLKTDGTAIISTLVKPTLEELTTLFSDIDNISHSIKFMDSNEFIKLYQATGLVIGHTIAINYLTCFESLYDLFKHFKTTGTSLPTNNKFGLNSKTTINELINKFEFLTKDSPFNLNYNYLIVLARKT